MLVLFPRPNRTEFALWDGERRILQSTLLHPPEQLRALSFPLQEGEFRAGALWEQLKWMRAPVEKVRSVFAPAGSLEGEASGVIPVTEDLLRKLRDAHHREHLLDVGAFVAYGVAQRLQGASAYVAEPISQQDDLLKESLLTGFPDVLRHPLFHAISQRGAAAFFAEKEGKSAKDLNLIVAHLGREISVGAHQKGRVIDVNSPEDGEGPFSAHLAGSLPVSALAAACYDPAREYDDWMRDLFRAGGIYAHLKNANRQALIDACESGDLKALELIDAMAYQIGKEVGRRSAALNGAVDAVLLTGPWSDFSYLTDRISKQVEWIAPVHVFCEMDSLDILAAEGRKWLESN